MSAKQQRGSGAPPLRQEGQSRDGSATLFSLRGGLGNAHQLFGEQLPRLRDELNEALAA